MNTPEPEENDDQSRRQVLAITLIVICYIVFTQFFAPQTPPPPPESPTTASVPEGAPPSANLSGAVSALPTASLGVAPAANAESAREFSSRWEGVQATFSNKTGAPVSLVVAGYREHNACDWLPGWIISGFTQQFRWERFSLACKDTAAADLVGDREGNTLPVGVDASSIAGDVGGWRVVSEGPAAISFEAQRGAFLVTRRYSTKPNSVVVGYEVDFRNTGPAAAELRPHFGVADFAEVPEDKYAPARETEAWIDGGLEKHGPDDLDDNVVVEDGPVGWLGVGDRYFLLGIEPAEPLPGMVHFMPAPGTKRYASVLELPAVILAPGETKSWAFQLYAGSKSKGTLAAANLTMQEAVDFGFFGLVAIPLLWALKFIYGTTHSWGVSIILLTICVKIVLFPLNQKSFRSMKGMQKLQPEIKLLQEKHKDDKEALNREMMGLWNKHGVNPMGGCLPMVAQMPIWFAMYQVLYAAVDLYQTHFLYFCDLSQRDPLGIFPLFLGASMYIQQKMTPQPGADPAQVKMMQYMTLFFAIIMFTMPAGLSVYMLVNNVLSIAQQQYITRSHDDAGGKTTKRSET